MKELEILQEPVGRVLVLGLQGFLDAHTAPEFEKVLGQAVDSGRCRIVVDASGLTYISSTGLGVFMAFIDPIRESAGDIKLAAVPPKVYRVFDLLGFPKLFEFFGTVSEAVTRFSGPEAAHNESP